MPIELFGFQIGKKKRNNSSASSSIKATSFVPPDKDEGASFIDGGGYFGAFIDFDAKAKTDKETSDKLQAYLIGLSDGMAWTDDFHKKINKKRIYCLGDKTADVFIMMAVVNDHIKNKNYTDDQKKLFPIGLIVADAFKTEFPCN